MQTVAINSTTHVENGRVEKTVFSITPYSIDNKLLNIWLGLSSWRSNENKVSSVFHDLGIEPKVEYVVLVSRSIHEEITASGYFFKQLWHRYFADIQIQCGALTRLSNRLSNPLFFVCNCLRQFYRKQFLHLFEPAYSVVICPSKT